MQSKFIVVAGKETVSIDGVVVVNWIAVRIIEVDIFFIVDRESDVVIGLVDIRLLEDGVLVVEILVVVVLIGMVVIGNILSFESVEVVAPVIWTIPNLFEDELFVDVVELVL